MIDVREVKLNLRYPESRQEDITDAFMRGYTNAVEIGNRAIVKLESENERLRELVRNLLRVIPRDVSGVVVGAHGEHPTYYSFADAMRELGVVDD